MKASSFSLTVIFAGVRQCNILPRRTVGRYSFEVSLGELALRSGLSTQVSGHTLNFLEPFSTGYLVRETRTKASSKDI